MHHRTPGRDFDIGIIGAGVALAVIGVAALAAPANPHHPHVPATTTTTSLVMSSTSLSRPSRITIPAELAHAIGQTRAAAEPGCPGGRATAWAEVDENGRVGGITAACTAGP